MLSFRRHWVTSILSFTTSWSQTFPRSLHTSWESCATTPCGSTSSRVRELRLGRRCGCAAPTRSLGMTRRHPIECAPSSSRLPHDHVRAWPSVDVKRCSTYASPPNLSPTKGGRDNGNRDPRQLGRSGDCACGLIGAFAHPFG